MSIKCVEVSILLTFSDDTGCRSSCVCRQTRKLQQNNEPVPGQNGCTFGQREEKESGVTSGEVRSRSGRIPFYTSVTVLKYVNIAKLAPVLKCLKMELYRSCCS